MSMAVAVCRSAAPILRSFWGLTPRFSISSPTSQIRLVLSNVRWHVSAGLLRQTHHVPCPDCRSFSFSRIQPLFGSKSEPKEQETNKSAAGAPPPPPSPAADETEEDAVSEVEKKLMTENEKLLEKVKEIDDKFKRALAEAENSRIRMRKQVEDAKIYGIQNFCKDLLDVADVLEKALETVPTDQLTANPALSSLFTGVQMTEKELQSVFRRHGLLRINPLGEKFNPNEHHALFESVIDGKEPGTVAVVTKIGYKLQERTIRPAMVGVVKAST